MTPDKGVSMFDLILVALLQAAAGDPAQPAETAPQTSEAPAVQAEAPQQATPAEEEVHCRREPIVGTRLSQRVCTTAAQDAALREEARQMINRGQSQSASRAD
jgi:hypothetical protein